MPYCAYCGTPVAETSYSPCFSCGNPNNGAAKPQLAAGGTNAAVIAVVVVIGGLFLVAILGIVAAIAIPNFLTALHRAKQKRTMADLRTIAVAVERYAAESGRMPDADSITALERQVGSAGPLPKKDGWGRDFRFAAYSEDGRYVIASAGKDGIFEHNLLRDYVDHPPGATTKFDNDIVYSNGTFLEHPEGMPAGGS